MVDEASTSSRSSPSYEGQPLGFTEEDLPRIREEYDRLTEAYMKRHREGRGFWFFHFNMDLSNGPCVAKRLSAAVPAMSTLPSRRTRPLSVPSVRRPRGL